MRKLLLLTVAVVGAMTATAGPAAAIIDPVPWGEEIVVIPGACVTDPCPYPYTVRVPDKPL